MKEYKQTTEYTCAASSLLMILHQIKGTKLTRENEFEIWKKSVNLPTRASSIYGLALVAAEKGVKTKIILEEKEYDYPDYRFKGYTKKEIDEAKFSSKIHAKKARENSNIIIEEKELGYEKIKKIIDEEKKIMLRVNAGIFRDEKSTSNYVVTYKEKNQIKIVDPKIGKKKISEEELKKAIETLKTKKKRDNRMIIFN